MTTTFNLTIETDNAAFGDDEFDQGNEIRRILTDLTDSGRLGWDTSGCLRDSNGNTVGHWELTPSEVSV